MRNYMLRSFAVLMLLAFATTTAFADKTRKAQLTLSTDVMVGDTLVKAGKYDFRFDESAGELSILKNGKVQAKASARLETRSSKANYTGVRVRKSGASTELLGLSFEGSNQDVVVSSAAAQR